MPFFFITTYACEDKYMFRGKEKTDKHWACASMSLTWPSVCQLWVKRAGASFQEQGPHPLMYVHQRESD